MKRIMIATALALASFVEAATPGVQQRKPRRKTIAELGGIVAMAPTGRVIRVANAQKRVPEDVLKATAEVMQGALGLPIVVSAGGSDARPGDNTAAVVVLADRGDAPRVLVAPEEGWAAVNTEALAADGATGTNYELRVTKEMWRALAIMLGASDSMFQPCLLAPVHSLADLDGLGCNVPSPEPFGKMVRNARALGCQPAHRATYKRACQEGWAPAPTNDVQRAIWEQVKADKERGPSNPITIKPPRK